MEVISLKREFKDVCKKITDFYVHLRAKTTGYPFKFHNGLKAKLLYAINYNCEPTIAAVLGRSET